ncbi:amidase signature domain-containing protein [Podospora appendiculata]|uniref:Glutamyl-tRNA(Gln) amidotransferase subunit A, mitochondrial n=1 Tax=Podospora appendiculata TaxID=314037 RepID=A0AAE0XJS4_9PEZI|nr:amidase signature domain-containing protein [Podospora appendiculata]
MSASAGLLRAQCSVRRCGSGNGIGRVAVSSSQQRRLLNHFISRDSDLLTNFGFFVNQPTAPPTPEIPPHDGVSEPSPAPAPPKRFTLAVKDNIATTTASLPTTCGSAFLAAHRSPFEATIVTQLRRRGAALVGKMNLDEFGMGSHSVNSAFGAVAQEISQQKRSAGGSSGGSAVAVATGEADVALGTDTGGSVRLPAAYTGTVGYKPSYGMLSRHGVVPYANSLDTVGLLARSVRAVAELVVGPGALWAEHDPRDPTSLSVAARARCASLREGYQDGLPLSAPPAREESSQSQPQSPSLGERYTQRHDGSSTLLAQSHERKSPEAMLKGVRFGIPLEYNIEELDPCIRVAWAAAAERLQALGARIVPVSLPSTRHALSAYYVIAPAEASSNLAKYDGVRYGSVREDTDQDSKTTDAADGGVLYAATRGRGFGDEVKRRILLGSYTLSSEAMDNYFLQAQKVRRLVRRDFDRVFALENPLHEREAFSLSDLPDTVAMENKFGPTEVDFLLCPTAPTLAPLLEDVLAERTPVDAYMNDVFTVPASLAGLPAISIPMTVAAGEEAVAEVAGLQLIGQFWDDARLLAVADAVSEILKAAPTAEGR